MQLEHPQLHFLWVFTVLFYESLNHAPVALDIDCRYVLSVSP